MHKKLLVPAYCDILYRTFLQVGTVAVGRIRNTVLFKMPQNAMKLIMQGHSENGIAKQHKITQKWSKGLTCRPIEQGPTFVNPAVYVIKINID